MIYDEIYGVYTLLPPYVLPFSSSRPCSFVATIFTHWRTSSMFRQDPATLQHSEQAFEAALTVLSSS